MWPLLILGALGLLVVGKAVSSNTAGSVSDLEIINVANYALAHESDPNILLDLSDKMHAVSPMPPAWYTLVVQLHNKAVQLQGRTDYWS